MNEIAAFPINLYRFLRHDFYRTIHFHARRVINQPVIARSAEVTLLSNLNQIGGHITHLDSLPESISVSFREVLPRIRPLVESLKKSEGHKSYFSLLSARELLDSGLVLLGLNEGLLDIAQKYIGMPVSYRGVQARKDFVDDQFCETRLWHRDPEDYRILKIIVYLNDVHTGSGPFQFFPVCHTMRLDWAPKNRKGRIDPEWCLNHFENRYEPTTCQGKAGSMIFTDTCRVYHRGMLPVNGERYTLFFAYTARNPAFPEYSSPLYDREEVLHKYAGQLSAVQKAALVKPLGKPRSY